MSDALKEPHLIGSLLISEGYENIERVRQITKGGSDAIITSKALISGPQPTNVELLSKISFFSKYFNAQYVPVHTQLYSLIEGDINPSINMFVLKSDYFKFQLGLEVSPYLSIGVQSRVGRAEVIRKNFYLLELGTDAGKNLMKQKKVNFSFFEPGFVIHDPEQKIQLTFMMEEMNQTSIPELNHDGPKTAIGFSYSIIDDIRFGRLIVTGDSRAHGSSFGFKFDYGVMSILVGTNQLTSSYGLLFFIKKMYSGIIFSKSNDINLVRPEQTIYTGFGIQI